MDGDTSSDDSNNHLWESSFYYGPSSTRNQSGNTSFNTSPNRNHRWNTNPAPYDNQLRNSHGATYMDASNTHFALSSAPFDNRLLGSSRITPASSEVVRSEDHRRNVPLSQASSGSHETVSLPSLMQELSAKMEMVSQLLVSTIMSGQPIQESFPWENPNTLAHCLNSFSPSVRTITPPATISAYTNPAQQTPNYTNSTTFSSVTTNSSLQLPPSNVFTNNYAGRTVEHQPLVYSNWDNHYTTALLTSGTSGSATHYLPSSSTHWTYTEQTNWQNHRSSPSNANVSLTIPTPAPSSNHSPTRRTPRMQSRTAHRAGCNVITNSANNTTLFPNSNFEMNGGSFTVNLMAPDAGFILLSQAASTKAVRDSQERCPPPRCHSKTRTKVIDDFFVWIKTLRLSKSVCWLHAPFGHGKSAVMQTIMDRMVAEGLCHLFAGGFFFGRGKPGRDKVIYLFATIAYQIAMFIPGMREHINNAMLADPTLPSKSIEIQLQSLIVDPLFNCADGSHFRHSPTLFIDGLDECDTIDDQVAVLDLIAITLHDRHIPLRFIIASRPEAHIRDCFNRNPLSAISERMVLPTDDGEMTAYVTTRFNEIYNKRSRIMQKADIHKPWPSLEDINKLVGRASGQYVFVDTILRFVDSHHVDPNTQLEIVLTRLSDASVFTDMDSIYRLILEQCPLSYRRVLNIIIDYLVVQNAGPNAIGLADLWHLPPAEVHIVVETLAAVIRELVGDVIEAHHVSFQEFLKDESRSGIFFRDDDLARHQIKAQDVAVFKLVLAGDLMLRDSRGLIWISWIPHGKGEDLMKNLMPSDLLDLVRRGQTKAASSRMALYQWFYLVDGTMQATVDYSGIFRTSEHCPWKDLGSIDMGVVVELYYHCLGIWKEIADKSFAAMDSRLVDAIFSMEPDSKFTASDVAEVAGMDEEECLCALDEHKVLFTCWDNDLIVPQRELSMETYLSFREDNYYR